MDTVARDAPSSQNRFAYKPIGASTKSVHAISNPEETLSSQSREMRHTEEVTIEAIVRDAPSSPNRFLYSPIDARTECSHDAQLLLNT